VVPPAAEPAEETGMEAVEAEAQATQAEDGTCPISDAQRIAMLEVENEQLRYNAALRDLAERTEAQKAAEAAEETQEFRPARRPWWHFWA
jgi:hypothetical protein